MASFSQISAALKELTPEGERFIEKDNKWIIKVNEKQYTVEKPEQIKVQSTIHYHSIGGIWFSKCNK